MRVLTPGHIYELSHFEGTGKETVRFIEKIPAIPLGSELVKLNDGTTNEEVLRMLIDRMQHLQTKAGCRENAIVVTKLEESLMWLEKRTADRKARGVEGTQQK